MRGAVLDAPVRAHGKQAARLQQVEEAQALGVGYAAGRAQPSDCLGWAPPPVRVRVQQQQQLRRVDRRKRGLNEAAELVGKLEVFDIGSPAAGAFLPGMLNRLPLSDT